MVENESDLFRGYGVEVTLKSDDDFLKVVETLTRIGVMPRGSTEAPENRLYQSCCILHKRGKFAIMHFKEMLALDGHTTTFNTDDKGRRNKIAMLLEQWGLVTINKPESLDEVADISKIKVIPFKEKSKYQLIQKYSIGKKVNHQRS